MNILEINLGDYLYDIHVERPSYDTRNSEGIKEMKQIW